MGEKKPTEPENLAETRRRIAAVMDQGSVRPKTPKKGQRKRQSQKGHRCRGNEFTGTWDLKAEAPAQSQCA